MDRRRIEAFGVLGIPADSDQEAVVHAFRRLARTTHPDVSAHPDAAGRFATVAAAYRLASAPLRAAREQAASIDRSEGGHTSPLPATPDYGLRRGWSTPSAPTLLALRHLHVPTVAAPIIAGPVRVDPNHDSATEEVGGG